MRACACEGGVVGFTLMSLVETILTACCRASDNIVNWLHSASDGDTWRGRGEREEGRRGGRGGRGRRKREEGEGQRETGRGRNGRGEREGGR